MSVRTAKRTRNPTWPWYEDCQTCGALSGNPCVARIARQCNIGDPLNQPHRGRYLKPEFWEERPFIRKDSGLTRAVLAMLTEEWTPYEQIMKDLASTIPPGIAYRAMTEKRTKIRTHRGQEDVDLRLSTMNRELTTYNGQRMIIQQRLQSLASQGRIEFQYKDPNAKRRVIVGVRLIPVQNEQIS